MGKNGMSFFNLLISSLLISKTICDVEFIRCPACPTCDIATKAEGLTWTPIPNMGQCALGMSFKINECTRIPRTSTTTESGKYIFCLKTED